MDNILTLEQQCRLLYESANEVERNQSQEVIVGLINHPDCLAKCQLLLERGSSCYAQLVAAKTLNKLLERRDVSLSATDRLEIRNYVLNYLLQRQSHLENYVQTALVHLYCRLTKQGWFDYIEAHNGWIFRDVVQRMTGLLGTNRTEMALLALEILNSLVQDISETGEIEGSRSLALYRKTVNSFRESDLFSIFRLSCQLLKDAVSNINNFSMAEPERKKLVEHILKLFHACLNFDFVGNAVDETGDDMVSVQIPTSWQSHFNTQDLVRILFSLYHANLPNVSSQALNCLVLMASIRRSFFSNEERARFLNDLVQGVVQVMERPQGLISDVQCYHDFCRLVARLKTNYQLSELVKVDGYGECIRMLAQFTVQSLQSPQIYNNALHYLLCLWQRMVASVPYVRANEPHYLEQVAPQVFHAFVHSRLNLVPHLLEAVTRPVETSDKTGVLGEMMPAESEEEQEMFHATTLSQQMDHISILGRANYDDTCQLLVELFRQSATEYEEVVVRLNGLHSHDQMVIQRLVLQQYRLAWLVYIMGAVISGRTTFNTTEEHDSMDGFMSAQVVQLLQLTDLPWREGAAEPRRGIHNRHPAVQRGGQRLELALLSFMDHFRKIYVGDSVVRSNRVYQKLAELLSITDEGVLLQVFVNKIFHNLKYWGDCVLILNKTLAILNDFSVGHNTVRKMQKLDTIAFLLANHSGEHFSFLGLPPNIQQWQGWHNFSKHYQELVKYRSGFYIALGRIFMQDFCEDEEKFYAFMRPFTESMEKVASWFLDHNRMIGEMEVKLLIVGLCRDLRGVAQAFTSKAAFQYLFDWFYPGYANVLVRALQTWPQEFPLSRPLLRLFDEMALNRSNRLSFDACSPNGLLLFRETSHVLTQFGEQLLRHPIGQDKEMYAQRQKAVAACFSLMKAALTGGYAHFATFSLYGDSSLDNAVQMFIKLLFSISKDDLLHYPKLGVEYYALLETLTTNHFLFLGLLSLDALEYLISTLGDGLNSLNPIISANCSHALDEILSHMFNVLTKSLSESGMRNKPTTPDSGASLTGSLTGSPSVTGSVNGSSVTARESGASTSSGVGGGGVAGTSIALNTPLNVYTPGPAEILQASQTTRQLVRYRRQQALELAASSTAGGLSNGTLVVPTNVGATAVGSTGVGPAGALDYRLACNLLQLWQRQADADKLLLALLHERSAILQQITFTLLHTLMYEDCRTQWSMSRPFFCLYLLLPQYFAQLKDQIVASQSLDRREAMQQCFSVLGTGITQTLTSKDRDRFTQNISLFRRDVAECLRSEMGVSSREASGTSSQRDAIDMMG